MEKSGDQTLIRLVVQRQGQPSQVAPVTRSPFRIGSREGLSLCLPFDGVGEHHCDLRADREGHVSVRPYLPLKLNGVEVQRESSLSDGDRLTLGSVMLVLQVSTSKRVPKVERRDPSASQGVSPADSGHGVLSPTQRNPSHPDQASVPHQASAPSASFSESRSPSESASLSKPASQERRSAHYASSSEHHPAQRQRFELQRRLHRGLLENLDLKRLDVGAQSEAEMRRKAEGVLKDLVSKMDGAELQGLSVSKLVEDVVHQALGLGPLEDLLADDDISEIMVNRFNRIYVERQGRLELSPVQFLDDGQVVEVIRRIIAPIGRRIDESQPMVDGRLSDGSRVNAIIPPLAISGPSITIRKFSKEPFGMEDIVGFGSLTPNMAKFLDVCVRYRKNICISGGTGSGKTTLLGVVASSIPDGERIVTIEDAAELRLPQEHIVALESKPANLEGQGAIPIRKLVINSLRMRPDRIIVGECRGSEALDMLQAMNTGHDGSLTTLHANTCRDAISRLETMVLMAGMNLPSKAIVQQIASAVDVIVQTNRFPDGSRRITSISVVDGMEGETVTLQEIFSFSMKGYDRDGKVVGEYVAEGGIPSFYLELQQRGIEVDMEIFS